MINIHSKQYLNSTFTIYNFLKHFYLLFCQDRIRVGLNIFAELMLQNMRISFFREHLWPWGYGKIWVIVWSSNGLLSRDRCLSCLLAFLWSFWTPWLTWSLWLFAFCINLFLARWVWSDVGKRNLSAQFVILRWQNWLLFIQGCCVWNHNWLGRQSLKIKWVKIF